MGSPSGNITFTTPDWSDIKGIPKEDFDYYEKLLEQCINILPSLKEGSEKEIIKQAISYFATKRLVSQTP
jgi:hypothetical protein